MESLARKNLVGAKAALTTISRTFTPLVTDLGVGSGKSDPERLNNSRSPSKIEILKRE